MKNSLFYVVLSLSLFFSLSALAGKSVSVVFDGDGLNPAQLLLQTGDELVFKNRLQEGMAGQTISISDAVQTIISPEIGRGSQWTYTVSGRGDFTFWVQGQPSAIGKATVFTKNLTEVSSSNLQKERASYSIGYDFGQQVVKKLDNLDLLLFVAGLQHAYNDEEPKLSAGEMEFIIADYKRGVARRAKLIADQLAEKNLNESIEFMERNKTLADVMALKSGLQYRVLKKGQGKKPVLGDRIKVHYKGTFTNGVEFDNTYITGVSEFVLTSQVLPGMVEGLMLMSEGSKWQLFVPPYLAYGKRGQHNSEKSHLSIEPNAALLFELELLKVLGDNLILGRSKANH